MIPEHSVQKRPPFPARVPAAQSSKTPTADTHVIFGRSKVRAVFERGPREDSPTRIGIT